MRRDDAHSVSPMNIQFTQLARRERFDSRIIRTAQATVVRDCVTRRGRKFDVFKVRAISSHCNNEYSRANFAVKDIISI